MFCSSAKRRFFVFLTSCRHVAKCDLFPYRLLWGCWCRTGNTLFPPRQHSSGPKPIAWSIYRLKGCCRVWIGPNQLSESSPPLRALTDVIPVGTYWLSCPRKSEEQGSPWTVLFAPINWRGSEPPSLVWWCVACRRHRVELQRSPICWLGFIRSIDLFFPV